VLFRNAGIGAYGIQELMSSKDLARVFVVNVIGVQRVMRAALPHLRTQPPTLLAWTTSMSPVSM
jgi:NAD(P)-dependent dehydrogenase (short-subunit alcohol dehydrogenase family)